MTLVTATIRDPSGALLAGARIICRLSAQEYDGGLVVPILTYAETNSAGVATFALWPNSRGTLLTTYTIRVQHPFMRPSLEWKDIVVPDMESITLQALLTGTTPDLVLWDDTEIWDDTSQWAEPVTP